MIALGQSADSARSHLALADRGERGQYWPDLAYRRRPMKMLAKVWAWTLALLVMSTGLPVAGAAEPMCYGCYMTYGGAGYYPPGGYSAGYYRPAFIYPPPAYQMVSPYNQPPYALPYVYPVPYVSGPPACSGYDRHCPQ
jgi:hypothetical protein